MKPSSLLKDANKENLRSQLSQRGSSVQDTGTKRMDEIFEENVEEFVTQILQQCVQDMNQQVVTGDEFSGKIGDETSKMSALSCFETSEPDCLKTENQLELSSGLSQAVENMNGNGNQSFEKYELPAQSAGTENVETCPRRSIKRHELVSQFGDMSVNEDSLLGDSHYSDCSESFTECSKSEEELLSSFVQTPETNTEHEGETVEISHGELAKVTKPPTPRLSFLEKVAIVQRVKSATSSLASWVFPHDSMNRHLQRIPSDEKVRLVHDVACSPMLHGPRAVSTEVDTLDRKCSVGKTLKLSNDVACSPMPQKSSSLMDSDSSSAEGKSCLDEEDAKVHDEASAPKTPEKYSLVSYGGLTDKNISSQNLNVAINDKQNMFNIHIHLSVNSESESSVDCALSMSDLVDKEVCKQDEELETGTTVELSENVLEEKLNEAELGFSTEISGIVHGYSLVSGQFVSSTETQTELYSPTQNKKFYSVACSESPLGIPVCDFSVQNEFQTQSAICSPIRFEHFDVSIQNEADMQSVLCSPIRFPGLDVSIQNKAEMQSIMCSPVRIPVHDISVQHEVDNRSVMCSPMVPCPSEDKSVLVSGPETTDAEMMTDLKKYTETWVEVYPEVNSVFTEMDKNMMISTSTSMTPFKIEKKAGKKLSAEDVRKQHPRVIANELETLQLENSRLIGQVHSFKNDRKKLVEQQKLESKLTEVQKALDEQKDEYSRESEEWREKQELLQAEIAALRLEHEKEIIKVRAEYESNDYREHFYASQKLVQELQLELDQYIELADDIEQAQNLQSEISEAVTEKVKHKAEWMKERQKEIQLQEEDLRKRQAAYSIELQALEEGKLAVQKEQEQMALIVHSCKENMFQLDNELQKTASELGATKETVLLMREEMDTVTKERDHLKAKADVLDNQNKTLQSEVDKLSEEVSGKNSALHQLEEQLELTKASLTEMKENTEKEIAVLKDKLDKKSLVVTNLERTLENREGEIDILEKDLYECREIICVQMEAAKTHQAMEQDLNAEIEVLKQEVDRLKDCCVNLRTQERETRSSLERTQEELNGTQEYASRIIRKQGTEISDCSSAIGELIDHMTSVFTSLSRKAGIEESLDGSNDGHPGENITHDSQKSQLSLVSQVLNAAKSLEAKDDDNYSAEIMNNNKETCCEHSDKLPHGAPLSLVEAFVKEQKLEDSPSTQSRKKLGFTGHSAFAPIKSKQVGNSADNKISGNQLIAETDANKSQDSKNMTIERTSIDEVNDLNDANKGVSQQKFEEIFPANDDSELAAQVTQVTQLFQEIIRVAHLIEKALRSSLNDVTFENDDLSSKVSQCEYSERRLQAELQATQTELTKSKTLVDQLNEKVSEMGDQYEVMLDQQTEIKRLQDEICRLRGKLESVKAERELLNEQIGELLEKMAELSTSQGLDRSTVDAEREILSLQKKVEKYRTLLKEKEALMEQIGAKATSRIQKLEANWKKAEDEVCRFDELVDNIRIVLVNHNAAMEDAKLANLVDLIDGKETTTSFKHKMKLLDSKPN